MQDSCLLYILINDFAAWINGAFSSCHELRRFRRYSGHGAVQCNSSVPTGDVFELRQSKAGE
jgi:hypothetical protein